MKGSLQLVSCVCIASMSAAQELTAIHINLKGVVAALIPCFTQEVKCNTHPLDPIISNCIQTSYC